MSMAKALQAKHIDECAILSVLRASRVPMTHWEHGDTSIPLAAEKLKGLPEKVLRAKLGAMARRGLVDGCACGCRGDWTITAEGRKQLEAA